MRIKKLFLHHHLYKDKATPKTLTSETKFSFTHLLNGKTDNISVVSVSKRVIIRDTFLKIFEVIWEDLGCMRFENLQINLSTQSCICSDLEGTVGIFRGLGW